MRRALLPQQDICKEKKTGSFSLIERVILSAGAMLIFSVYFHLTKCPEGRELIPNCASYTPSVADSHRLGVCWWGGAWHSRRERAHPDCE